MAVGVADLDRGSLLSVDWDLCSRWMLRLNCVEAAGAGVGRYLGYWAGRYRHAQNRPTWLEIEVNGLPANDIGGTHVVWASAHVESTRIIPGRIPGSIRFTKLDPNFVGKDSGHHKCYR